METLLNRLVEVNQVPLPPKLPPKDFKPEFPNIPRLKSYSQSAPKSFWEQFPKNRNWRGGSPYKINTEVLSKQVAEAGGTFELTRLLSEVRKDIEQGADLKVSPEYVPQRSKNAESAIEEGYRVTDEIAKGVATKILAGPFDECPTNATINSLQTKIKPNGRLRLIMNESLPKGKGVNQFISKKEYPPRMGGMKEIVLA